MEGNPIFTDVMMAAKEIQATDPLESLLDDGKGTDDSAKHDGDDRDESAASTVKQSTGKRVRNAEDADDSDEAKKRGTPKRKGTLAPGAKKSNPQETASQTTSSTAKGADVMDITGHDNMDVVERPFEDIGLFSHILELIKELCGEAYSQPATHIVRRPSPPGVNAHAHTTPSFADKGGLTFSFMRHFATHPGPKRTALEIVPETVTETLSTKGRRRRVIDSPHSRDA